MNGGVIRTPKSSGNKSLLSLSPLSFSLARSLYLCLSVCPVCLFCLSQSLSRSSSVCSCLSVCLPVYGYADVNLSSRPKKCPLSSFWHRCAPPGGILCARFNSTLFFISAPLSNTGKTKPCIIHPAYSPVIFGLTPLQGYCGTPTSAPCSGAPAAQLLFLTPALVFLSLATRPPLRAMQQAFAGGGGGGGGGNVPAAGRGRGRGSTIPAWMTHPNGPGGLQESSRGDRGDARCDTNVPEEGVA